jgi:hypothetical protein
MGKLSGISLFLLLPLAVSVADDKELVKGKETGYEVHSGYFESNKSGLKGDASYLTFTDQESFDKVFGKATVMGKRSGYLPKDVFDTRRVVAIIKRGPAVTEYNVQKVTIDAGTVYVQYETKAKAGGGTARYASPLIVSFDKGKYTSIVFIENGKKVETLKLDQDK